MRDMLAFLRQRGLRIWDKNDASALEIRALGYRTNRSAQTYITYMGQPESAANCLLCLIHQANYLLDQQLRALDKDLAQNGDFKDGYKQARRKQAISQIYSSNHDYDDFLRSLNMRRLENGQVVGLNE